MTTPRMEELSAALDNRDVFKPFNISGSGKIYQKTFWLDIADRLVIIKVSNYLSNFMADCNLSGHTRA